MLPPVIFLKESWEIKGGFSQAQVCHIYGVDLRFLPHMQPYSSILALRATLKCDSERRFSPCYL